MAVYSRFNFPVNKDNVPVLSREDIQLCANALIHEYRPDLLKNPDQMDVDDFMEFYLKLNVEIHALSHNMIYFGRCIFNDNECVPIYDQENEVIRSLSPVANTIVIEQQLYVDETKEALRRFTIAHECAHYILHRQYFVRHGIQLSLFDDDSYEINHHAALKANELKQGKRELSTSNDWLEWQANTLASYLLMNQSSMEVLFKDWEEDDFKSIFKHCHAVHLITDTYGVSHEAAKVRLNLYLDDMNITI